MKRMTDIAFAAAECGNMTSDDGCLGLPADMLIDDDRRKTVSPLGQCLLIAGERCAYFERVILPIVDQPSPAGDPDLQARRLAAKVGYLARHGIGRTVAQCADCRDPVPKGKRLCESCAKKRQREAAKEGMRRRRQERASRC